MLFSDLLLLLKMLFFSFPNLCQSHLVGGLGTSYRWFCVETKKVIEDRCILGGKVVTSGLRGGGFPSG